jgi:hypothetical protein
MDCLSHFGVSKLETQLLLIITSVLVLIELELRHTQMNLQAEMVKNRRNNLGISTVAHIFLLLMVQELHLYQEQVMVSY